jgi:uncharacterized Zn finger protein
MPCPRCAGLTVMEALRDLKSTLITFEVARCLNCGYIEDPQMLVNRRNPPPVAMHSDGTPIRRASARLRSPMRAA